MSKQIETYYHATPVSNLNSIRKGGIVTGIDGVVYCSTEEETCARWISFTRMHSERIVVLPFRRYKGDATMGTFLDSSPMMLTIIGVDPATHNQASMASSVNISADDILWHEIVIYDNPFFNEEAKKMHDDMMKKHRHQMPNITKKATIHGKPIQEEEE